MPYYEALASLEKLTETNMRCPRSLPILSILLENVYEDNTCLGLPFLVSKWHPVTLFCILPEKGRLLMDLGFFLTRDCFNVWTHNTLLGVCWLVICLPKVTTLAGEELELLAYKINWERHSPVHLPTLLRASINGSLALVVNALVWTKIGIHLFQGIAQTIEDLQHAVQQLHDQANSLAKIRKA